MMETCGCCFDPIFGPMGALVGGNIIYCPQHSSANVMYEALERCRNTLTVMNAITPNYHLEGALQEVLGAIDLADGKTFRMKFKIEETPSPTTEAGDGGSGVP